jgi:hypothetical protein
MQIDFCKQETALAGISCMGVDAIYTWFEQNGYKIYGAYKSKYIDFVEYESPIKTELVTLFLYSLKNSYTTEYST